MAIDGALTADIPPVDKMLRPVLRALMQMGGSGTIKEIDDQVIRIAGFTESQQSVLHGGGPQTEIAYRLAWARTWLGMFGAVGNSGRGVWAITELGKTLQEADMARVVRKVRARSRGGNSAATDGGGRTQARRRVPARRLISGDTATTDDEGRTPAGGEGAGNNLMAFRISSTVYEEWRDKLREVLQALPPDRFERLCQRVLRESGFTKVEVTGRSGDGGVDGVGVVRVSLLSFRVFFQCKRYTGSVASSAIRDFRGAMVGRSDKGLLITTGSFTADAIREATRDGAPVLDLIDGEQLCQILKDLRLGLSARQLEEVTIDPAWFAAL